MPGLGEARGVKRAIEPEFDDSSLSSRRLIAQVTIQIDVALLADEDQRGFERRKVALDNSPDDAVIDFVIAVAKDVPDTFDVFPRDLGLPG